MKSKIVLWGNDEADKRILVAMELLANENKVAIWTFPEEIATDELANALMNEWRDGKEVPFPEGHSKIERELTVADSVLPDEIKVERTDVVQRAQTEWHFMVLSSKLNASYQAELEELKEKVEKLESFDKPMWESLKSYWSKVQKQVRDRNLFREHADSLKEGTNELFSKMKTLKASLDAEFNELAKSNYDRFMGVLDNLEEKIKEGTQLSGVFNELKDLQRNFRNTKFTREFRSKVWERLDGAFKTVKEKRFGPDAVNDNSPMERLKRRYNGLLNAIEKMERSIARDKDDLKFENSRIEDTDGQLELQIRQAKLTMITSRILSKEEKLSEMKATQAELEQKMVVQKERDVKREERDKIEKAKKEAKAKIAQDIKAEAEARKVDSEKLEKAANAIQSQKEPKKELSTIEKVKENIEHAVEDIVDTAKAVKEVVGEKIGEVIDDITDKVDDAKEAIVETTKPMAEKVEDVKEAVKETISETVEEVKDKIDDTSDADA